MDKVKVSSVSKFEQVHKIIDHMPNTPPSIIQFFIVICNRMSCLTLHTPNANGGCITGNFKNLRKVRKFGNKSPCHLLLDDFKGPCCCGRPLKEFGLQTM